ncbi:hypothetical protein [Spirochaeta thermophila]|nr:hypothetical protein [Spirochaeta thermophila]
MRMRKALLTMVGMLWGVSVLSAVPQVRLEEPVVEELDLSPELVVKALVASLEAREVLVEDDAGYVLTTRVWGGGRRGVIAFRLYVEKGETRSLVAAVVASFPLNLSFYAEVDRAVEDLLHRWLSRFPEVAAPEDAVFPVEVRGPDEGAVVKVGDVVLGTIEEGVLVGDPFRVVLGSRVKLTVEKEGYFPRDVEVVIEESPVVVELPPLLRQHRFEVGLFSTLGQLKGAGVEARWYALPDQVFAGLREYVYGEGGGRWWMPEVVFRSQTEVVAGAYLVGGVSSAVRLWMETGIGGYLSFVEGMPFDLYYHLIGLGVEWVVRPGWALYARTGYDYAAGTGLLPQGGLFLYPKGGPALSVGVGYRW